MRLAKMLKLYRAAEGIDQKAMAEQIGIGHSTLCRLEQGKGLEMKAVGKLIAWMLN